MGEKFGNHCKTNRRKTDNVTAQLKLNIHQLLTFPQLPIPSCTNDLHRYMNSMYGIIPNLPLPMVHKPYNGAAYALSSEVIRIYYPMMSKFVHAIYSEDDIEKNGTVHAYWQTNAALKKLREKRE